MKRQWIFAVSLLWLAAAGCSVGMALHGEPERNLGALHVGQPRQEVLMVLGQPAQTFTTDTGRTDVFTIERGNAPSAGRAIGHGVMDVLTLGAWEIVGTPIEGFIGDELTLTVMYDTNDYVTRLTTGPETGSF